MSDNKFDFNLIKLPELIKYKNSDCFLCTVRQKFIQSKPEENFRQQVILYLINTLGYPINHIAIEVPISYFQPKMKGRADIIIYDRPYTYPNAEPYILIECKAPGNNITLDDYRHHNQINNYNKSVRANIIMLTNGNDVIIKETTLNRSLERLPTFLESKNNTTFKFSNIEQHLWRRTTYKDRFDRDTIASFVERGIISSSTNAEIAPYIIHLADLFYEDSEIFNPQQLGNFELIKDGGLRPANYGHAFGAGLVGSYRFFLFKQSDGNHRIISFSIYHQREWGTYLMVSVDDRQGHSVELRLDRYIKPLSKDIYEIWHNGSLTVGKKGRIKNIEVIDFLKNNAPFLIRDDKVILGTLNLSKELTFEQKEVKDFILRAVIYAIMREQIRQIKQ